MKRFTIFLAAGAVAVAGVSCSRTLTAGAALVNGVSISQKALDSAVERAGEQPAGGDEVAAARNELTTLILKELINQAAKNRGIKVDQKEVDEQFNQLKGQAGSPEEFASQLQQNGFTEQSLREELGFRVALDKLAEKLVPTIDDAQLQAIYDTEKAQFRQVRARDMLFAVDDKTNDAQAKVQAQAAVRDLRTGTSFASLARKLSDDPATARNGGSLGAWHGIAQDEPALGEAYWKAKLGRVGAPVRDQRGYHVFVVTKKRYQPFAEVKDQLRADLEGSSRDRAIQGFLAEQAGKVQIIVNPRYGDWDPETQQITPHESFVPAEPEESIAPPINLGGGSGRAATP